MATDEGFGFTGVVLNAPPVGKTASLNPVGSSNPYVKIPRGVNHITVVWDGPIGLWVHYAPRPVWGELRRVGTIPDAAANTPRRFAFSVAAETDEYAVLLRPASPNPDGGEGYTAGLQIVTAPPPA